MNKTSKSKVRRYIMAAAIGAAAAGLYGCTDDASTAGPSSSGLCDGLCTESQTCISGSCIDNARICGDAICPKSQSCINDMCVNNDKICGDAICLDSQTCIDSTCISNDKICGEAICTDSQTCIDYACVSNDKICGSAVCTDSETCKDSTCVANDSICGEEICTDAQTCIESACIDNSKICGDAVCTIDETCREGACVETKKICGDVLCEESETCLNEMCVPTDSICGDIVSCDLNTEECVDNTHCEPIDPCRNVVCEVEGQICDNGECRDRKPCENIQCNDGQECAITTLSPLGECIDAKCAVETEGSEYKSEKTCDENQMCVGGECIDDGCVDKTCSEGWICIKGNCEEEACIGKVCDDGRTCVPANALTTNVFQKKNTCAKKGRLVQKATASLTNASVSYVLRTKFVQKTAHASSIQIRRFSRPASMTRLLTRTAKRHRCQSASIIFQQQTSPLPVKSFLPKVQMKRLSTAAVLF